MQQKARRAGRVERLEAALGGRSKARVGLGGADARPALGSEGEQLEVN